MTLAVELTNDPLGRGYAGMTPTEVVADLNLRIYPAQTVSVREVDTYLSNNLLWPDIEDLAATANADTTARKVARTLLRLPSASYDDVLVAVASPLLDILVAAGVLNAQNKTDLLALADNKLTRLDALGVGRIVEQDIIDARGY